MTIDNTQVKSPSHYALLEDVEVINIIRNSMTEEMWKGYCLGNIMKYRLRAGKKGDATTDLAKADEMSTIYHKGCGVMEHARQLYYVLDSTKPNEIVQITSAPFKIKTAQAARVFLGNLGYSSEHFMLMNNSGIIIE